MNTKQTPLPEVSGSPSGSGPLWAEAEGMIVEATKFKGFGGMTNVRNPLNPDQGEWLTHVEKIHILHRTSTNPKRNGRIECHGLCKQVRPGSPVQRCRDCGRLWMLESQGQNVQTD